MNWKNLFLISLVIICLLVLFCVSGRSVKASGFYSFNSFGEIDDLKASLASMPVTTDLDSDGDQDIIIIGSDGRVYLYENNMAQQKE